MAPPTTEYTGVEEALGLVMARIRADGKIESIDTVRSYGRVLAADVVAPEDVPPASTSHMDGYAVITGDLKGATPSQPSTLEVVDAIGPGDRSKRRLVSGQAILVATGATLPRGADAVVPVESAEVTGREVRVGFSPRRGEHIFEAGQDIRRGDLILPEGHRIRAQDVGILVSLGFRRVRVRKRVTVAVLATGDELTPASRPRKGKKVESHSPIFLLLAEALGCGTLDMGVARDDSKVLRTALGVALTRSDFVVTLGGTSAGKRDLVVGAVSGLRPDALVHGLRLDRGRVTGLASVKGKPILMLPGPIQAAANAFMVVGVPIIGELAGSKEAGLSVPCVLGAPWEARKRFSDFQKVVYVKLKAGPPAVAEPITGETESMKLLTEADGYFLVPENGKRLKTGDRVNVRLVPGFSFA
jgi:molybdopterin molybdotransferase